MEPEFVNVCLGSSSPQIKDSQAIESIHHS
jgi:hypothetical protein